MAHFASWFLPLNTDEIFFLLEWIFVSLVYFSILHLLLFEFSHKQASVLSWLFMLLLPLTSVINYRFAATGQAPFYFPNDSASLFFMAFGMLLCLQSRWNMFVPLVFLATFNRESSILLVLLIPALHWSRLRDVIRPLIVSILVFVAAKLLIIMLVHHLPGQYVELYFFQTNHTHFEVNFLRLLEGQQIFFFPFCLACLPLFWFAYYDYIPQRYQPLRYVALVWFLALLVVGNFIEARIFGEIIVLIYLPVCVSLYRWLTEQPANEYSNYGRPSFYVNRYAILALLTLVILFRHHLNTVVISLSHYYLVP